MKDKWLEAYQGQVERRGIILRDCPLCGSVCYNYHQLIGHLFDHGLSRQEAIDKATELIASKN